MSVTRQRGSRVWGYHFRISRYADNAEIQRQVDTSEVTVLEDQDKKYIPMQRYGNFKVTGIASAYTTGTASTMSTTALSGTNRPAWQDELARALGSTLTSAAFRRPQPGPWTAQMISTGGPPGAAGARAYLFPANQTEVSYSMPAAQRVGVSINVQPSSKVQWGRLLLNTASTFSATGAGPTVDWGTPGINTAAARPILPALHYHLTDLTTVAGSTVATFRMVTQHSTNGSVWVDLAGTSWITTGAGALRKGSRRINISTGITVKRFMRVNIPTGGYTGGAGKKISFMAAFARSSE